MTSEFLGGFKLRNGHGEEKFGRNIPSKTNPLLRFSGNLNEDKTKIRDPGSPGIEEHIRLLCFHISSRWKVDRSSLSWRHRAEQQ